MTPSNICGATVLLNFFYFLFITTPSLTTAFSLSYLGRLHRAKKTKSPLGVSESWSILAMLLPLLLLLDLFSLTPFYRRLNYLLHPPDDWDETKNLAWRTEKNRQIAIAVVVLFYFFFATTTILRLYLAVILLDTGPSLLLLLAAGPYLLSCSRCLDSIGGWHGSVGFLLFVFLADGFWLRLWLWLWEVIRAVYFLRRWMGGVDSGRGIICEGCFESCLCGYECIYENNAVKKWRGSE